MLNVVAPVCFNTNLQAPVVSYKENEVCEYGPWFKEGLRSLILTGISITFQPCASMTGAFYQAVFKQVEIWYNDFRFVACTICFTIVIYDRNDSGQYYKTMTVVKA